MKVLFAFSLQTAEVVRLGIYWEFPFTALL
jgi:hypothetical protein